jgi:hypothetical protein
MSEHHRPGRPAKLSHEPFTIHLGRVSALLPFRDWISEEVGQGALHGIGELVLCG